MNRKIGIFCGAREGISKEIIHQAEELCDLLIEQNFELVYGGGRTGLMGIVANRFLKAGKKVIGVRPKKLIVEEDAHQALTDLIVVDSMQARKSKMIELSDIFIALPGGVGTLDEIIETFTLNKIGFTDKPSGILNTANYFEGLEQLIGKMVASGFLDQEDKDKLIFANTPAELIEKLIFRNIGNK